MARQQQDKRKRQQQAGPSGKRAKRGQKKAAGGQHPTKQQDLYEAEDSDPDEDKHKNRYDNVENYEYEMPSEFEDDEEIDEDLAFTEEDKKKYGAWFREDEEDAGGSEAEEDEEQGQEGSSDADMDMLDSEQEMEAGGAGNEDDESEGPPGSEDDAPEEQHGGKGGDDDDGFLDMLGSDDEGGIEGSGDEEGGDDEGSEGGEQDEERHRHMLQSVLGQQERAKAANAKRAQQAVMDEAYPESEYNLNPGAASTGTGDELTLADLMQGLGGEAKRKLPGTTRKLLEKMSGGEKKAEPAPLPRVIKERQERKAGYEATSKDVAKWQPIVKANREAPTLHFTSARHEVPRINTTAAIVAQHTPESTMEEEVAALLQSAGAASSKAVAESEDKLAMKALTMEEARARRDRLAKLRTLLFYDELKAKRLKNIKSKEYHRKQNKAAKRRALRLGDAMPLDGDEGDEAKQAERAQREQAELDRAKERLTLKHRNTSRWARRALKRGATLHDPGTKAAIADQIQIGQALKRKIEGGRASDSEGSTDASTSASEDEHEGGNSKKPAESRAKALAMEMMAGGAQPGSEGEEEKPKKGLFSLPFMARAQEKKRQAAQEQAQAVLRDLQQEEQQREAGSDEDANLEADFGGGPDAQSREAASGRFVFGGGVTQQQNGMGGGSSDEDGGASSGDDSDGSLNEDAEAKAERLSKVEGKERGGALGAGGGGVMSRGMQQQQQQRGRRKGQQRGAGGALGGQQQSAEDEAALQAALEAAGVQTEGVASQGTGEAAHNTQQHQPQAHQKQQRQQQQQQQQLQGELHAEALASRAAGASGTAAARARLAGFGASEQQQASTSGSTTFMPARSFQGPRPGFAFRSGPQGLGYYQDLGPAAAPTQSGAAPTSKAQARQQQQQQQKQQKKQKDGQGVRIAGMPVSPSGEDSLGVSNGGHAANGGGGHGQNGAAELGGAGGAAGAAGAEKAAGKGGDSETEEEEEDERRRGGSAKEGMRPAPASHEATQQELIRMAFAGDDVEAEFAADKAAEIGSEMPHIEEPSVLPGWGVWAEQQRDPKWMKQAKEKARKEREKAAEGRRDKGMQFVTISEKWDRKAMGTYTTPSVPFPFDSKDTYERSIRQPLGRQYNPDSAFRDLTRPAVLKNTGVVIDPIRYSKPLAKQTSEVASKSAKPKVLTVAGGANQKPKKRS